MIINRNVIHDEILRQTLQQEVTRLNILCSHRNISYLEQQIRTLEKSISYEAYAHNQKVAEFRSEMEYKSRRYNEVLKEKKQKDVELRNLVESNRAALSNLQKFRKSYAEKRNLVRQAQQKSVNLKNEESDLERKTFECSKNVQEQQGWVKRLKAAEQLCRTQINIQKESLEKLKDQIKIQKLGNQIELRNIEELKRQVESTRLLKQSNFCKTEQERTLFELQLKQELQQSDQLNKEQEEKQASIRLYENEIKKEQFAIRTEEKQIQKRQEAHKEVQTKIVGNMNLIQEINNQIFSIKLNRTSSKVKVKETIEKIQRLRRLKGELFDLIY